MGAGESSEDALPRQDLTLSVTLGTEGVMSKVKVMTDASWAAAWYQDAQQEVTESGLDARRREILFAVCCAECYLFEWVRDVKYASQPSQLLALFPVGDKRGIKEKWKDITSRLLNLTAAGDAHDQHWDTLIRYRNGLIHAAASRPQVTGQTTNEGPSPAVSELSNLPGGWALNIVAERIKRLHRDDNTTAPSWL